MKATQFKAGMYLLETLTSGMYNDPLSIYREYLQNSVDSVDQSGRSPEDTEIKIQLNPIKQSVVIYDNGDGIAADTAEKVLSSIGSSGKIGTLQRGFRGIGRLGGIAFAKKVVFKTTAAGESIVSTQKWDCEDLRNLLRSTDHAAMSIEELFSRVTVFSQETVKKSKDISFFEVQLLNVESFRNYIFDIQRIKKYLIQVAPLPFNPEQFSFHGEVRNFLVENVPQYGEYKITLNDEQLFRPYKNDLNITSKQHIDYIEDVELFELKSGNTALAYGWYGKRRDLLGSIRKGASVSGLRIKVGNLQVGNQHLLDRCFRESRFNSYNVGEIHICDQSLLPNSRRDDFVDNKEKTLLYNLIEQNIGLPLSKEIRLKSRIQTKTKAVTQESEISSSITSTVETAPSKCKSKELATSDTDTEVSSTVIEELRNKCGNCQTLRQVLKEQALRQPLLP